MLPTVPKIQEGQPIEDVALIRDEMANMVWAVGVHGAGLPTGESKPGREGRAGGTAAFHARIVAALPPGTGRGPSSGRRRRRRSRTGS